LETPPDEAVFVVSRRIRQGQEKAYEDWVQCIIEAAKDFPGYRGVTTLLPEGIDSDLRYMVWRFENRTSLENWEKSDVRNRLLNEGEKYSIRHYETATGMETWFKLPNLKAVKAPSKWKMALVTLLAAYVISFVAHLVLAPYLDSWSFSESNFIYSSILVATLTYFALPKLSRLLRSWLYPA
jgi:uncharacterized protein